MAAIVTTPRLMAIGGGALGELPGVLQRFGLARPLVVTDPYIKSCGILDRSDRSARASRHRLFGLRRHGCGPDDRGHRRGHAAARRGRL